MGHINHDEPRSRQREEAVCQDINLVLMTRQQSALRAAVLQVLDDEDEGMEWWTGLGHPFPDVVDQTRLRLADAIQARFQEMCNGK